MRESRERVAVGHGAGVQREHAALRFGALVDRKEPRVVGPEALHRAVELEAGELEVVERLARDLDHVGVVGMERAQRDGLGQAPCGLGDPAVEVPRHPGLVGVAEEAEPLHAVSAERRRDGPWLPGVGVDPVVVSEVPLDRLGEPLGVQVDVDIDTWMVHGVDRT